MRCPCGHEEDVWAKASIAAKILDDHGKACPVCGCKMRRVPARTSFVLKGDGWTKGESKC
jgi:predicted nucleic acid-binding Zn ribbon protein